MNYLELQFFFRRPSNLIMIYIHHTCLSFVKSLTTLGYSSRVHLLLLRRPLLGHALTPHRPARERLRLADVAPLLTFLLALALAPHCLARGLHVRDGVRLGLFSRRRPRLRARDAADGGLRGYCLSVSGLLAGVFMTYREHTCVAPLAYSACPPKRLGCCCCWFSLLAMIVDGQICLETRFTGKYCTFCAQ